MKMKLSDYIYDFLVENSVNQCFMLPGGGAMHLVDSLGKSKMDYVCFLHEQAAAIAAESYGQHTNNPALVLVTSGPGSTNAITGVTAAWIDSTPMIVISGQAKRSDLVGDKGVRQIGSQEVDIISMMKGITKYSIQVMEPQNIRCYLERALYEATHGRKGPVWLDIPMDVQAAQIEPSELKAYYVEEDINNRINIQLEVKNVIERLTHAKKPLLLAGNGIISSGAEAEFESLVDLLNIPVQTTWKSVDLMYDGHCLYAGHPGALGDRGANFIIQESDYILSIGCRIDNSITAFNEVRFAPHATITVVDIDEKELAKFSRNIDQKVLCDAKDFIKELFRISREDGLSNFCSDDWREYCHNIRKQYPVINNTIHYNENGVNGYYFTGVLSSLLEEGDIIVPESSGITCEVTIQAFQSKKGQKMKHAAGLGSMGFGLPYSIGACIANNKKRTILINGDGAFQLNIQELETLHRLNLPVKIFVWNNRGYASIRNMQQNNFNGHYVASGEDSGVTLPNLCDVVKAYDINTFVINNNDEVEKTISKVLEADGPQFCEVIISEDTVVSPKVKARVGDNGEMIPGELDHMWPFID